MRPIQLYSMVHRRQRRNIAQAVSVRRRMGRAAFGCAAVMFIAVIAVVLAFGLFYANLTNELPSVHGLSNHFDPDTSPLMQPTRLYDRSGMQLIYSLENPGIPRRYLSADADLPDHLSPDLLRVTVGLLDPGFWQHPGFQLNFDSLTSLQPETIAERLALDTLLWQEPPGMRRALRMRLLAAQIVWQYGREQVLEWYLNYAYFGHLAYGADSAARLYLNQSATSLDLAGAALLVAVHQAPALNPVDAPSAALERQETALARLRSLGIISADDEQTARATTLNFPSSVPVNASPALAFSNLALDQLAARFGRDRLERGGLRIITSLDYNLQLEISCLARMQLLRLAAKPEENQTLPDGSTCQSVRLLPTLPAGEAAAPDGLLASAVVLDPRSGQVLALLGDTGLIGESQKQTAHPPGSLLSPFVAVTGFARGFGPASLVWDIPAEPVEQADLSVSTGAADQQAQTFRYTNPDGKFHGPVRMRIALANDYLVPLAQFVDHLGTQNVWRLAGALGLPSLARDVQAANDSTLLFSGGSASPLEIAQSYALFATDGIRNGQRPSPGADVQPSLVLYVEELDGAVLLDARQPETQTVLSAPLAYLVHHVLSDSTARWPSLGYPNPLEISRPAGAKIGRVAASADDGSQTWTVGYTPQRVAVIWLGDSSTAGPSQASDPRAVAGMWHALMQYMHRNLPVEDWTEPAGLSQRAVCDPSGLLPTAACPIVVNEIFLAGNEPNTADTLYRVYQINSETGRLATVFTPQSLIEEKTFLVAPPEARAWVLSAGLPLPPEDYDAIQTSLSSENVRISFPAPFDYVRGTVTIDGTANGAGFRFYQLQAGQGLNPRDWLQIVSDGAIAITDGPLGVWDTSGLEGLYAIRLLVVREDQTVETAVIQVTVDNTAPLVRALYPLPAQVIDSRQESTITFQADASDTVSVSRLVWLVDGNVVGENSQPPYVFSWPAKKGSHALTVKAYDPAGNEGISETVEFEVK